MDRNFTNREKALMLVLAVIILACAYYLLVFSPSKDAIDSSQTQVSQLQSELLVDQAMAQKVQTMQAELDQKKENGEQVKTTLEYDSAPVIMRELNNIMAGTKTYSLSFADAEQSEDGTMMRHSVNVTFTASSYSAAKRVIDELVNNKYTSLVTDFSITAQGDDGTAQASATIVYFESL